MVVYKDLKKSNFFNSLTLPSFMRDWLIKRFQAEDGFLGEEQIENIRNFIDTYIPRTKQDWNKIKSRIINESERVKILAKISVDIDIKTGWRFFTLSDFGLGKADTGIPNNVWYDFSDDFLAANEIWGIVELAYLPKDYSEDKKGKIIITDFKKFCPYQIDLNFYKEARKNFTIDEWFDVLLGAIDYNPSGYKERVHKRTMLSRLLPFVEKRLNLVELAPKGTGKSYVFERLSRFGYLVGGGKLSRAKLFYDRSKKSRGLIFSNDFVALDEIQTISASDPNDIRSALKTYMESGQYSGDDFRGVADAGIILLGNIESRNMDEYTDLFFELPNLFKESALIDRFHGFIMGWNIPRMNDDLKMNGFALNSEYFTSIMNLLRDDITYRQIVDEIIEVPKHADTRDTEAIKRTATAFLKLFFPNVQSPSGIVAHEFEEYCLRPASKMREIIKYQMGKLDDEFKGKDIPNLLLKEKFR
ncbi:MAG: BREX system Lon protease-like protein BrxL [Firmicutes bacterium]|nr:BREX system Lon protease-like protein BrxL [Bacillota bacterium]